VNWQKSTSFTLTRKECPTKPGVMYL